MKEYNVTITETLKMNVSIEAESKEEAIQKATDNWHNGDYILDADNFVDVNFEIDECTVDLSYQEMSDLFTRINTENKDHIQGFIVFSQSSFDKEYSELSRTYAISSDNKAFKPSAGGYSIFGSCLDGTDQNLRLEQFMRGSGAWKIEKCYINKADFSKYKELLSSKS